MKLITATKSPKKCNGFKGCGGDIFTGFRYVELKPKRGKFLCESCYNKTRLDKCSKFFNELINKVGQYEKYKRRKHDSTSTNKASDNRACY